MLSYHPKHSLPIKLQDSEARKQDLPALSLLYLAHHREIYKVANQACLVRVWRVLNGVAENAA